MDGNARATDAASRLAGMRDALTMDRPVVFFDLETTGADPATDRVVELSACRLDLDGTVTTRTRRIHPERPIPPEATAVHGITDADVADAPTFRQIARPVLEFFADADLAGFNVARFDAPLLDREMRDAGCDFGLARRRVVDVMVIYKRMEPRDLSAAVRHYLGRDHEHAHAAEADVLATAEVFVAQLSRHPDLPRSVAELDRWCAARRPGAVDRQGKFVWRGREIVFGFGKYQARPLREVLERDRGYVEWILRSDFPSDAVTVIREALAGRWPVPPDADQST